MSHVLSFRTGAGDDWNFHAERAFDGKVLFYVRAGPTTTCLYMTPEQAGALAGILQAARDDDVPMQVQKEAA